MPDILTPCVVCGDPLDVVMAGIGMLSHPNCMVPLVDDNPFDSFSEDLAGVPLPQLAADLKAEFTTMVRWHEEFTPRAQQAHLGPSDLGNECDRKLAYKIAGLRGSNIGDPWPSFVGSSIHTRLEGVVRKYGEEHGGAWMIEQQVIVDPLVRGSADLFRSPVVVDIKSAGKDMLDKVKKSGPPDSYKIQINLYAKGLNSAGYPVKSVAFVFVPRSGWLEQMYVWAAPYDEELANRALARPYELAGKLQQMDIRNNPQRWQQIDASPSYLCTWCPMYDKHRPQEQGADDRGCPGTNR
jgi:hypothetical protein